MTLFWIIIGIIVFIGIVVIICCHSHNKYQWYLLKLNKAEHDIEELLDKKLDLLERIVPFIEENQKEEVHRLNKLQDLKEKQPNNLDLYRYLTILAHEVKLILEEHTELEEIKQLKTILEFLTETEGQLLGAIDYYNHNTREYNELRTKFPHNITKSLFHCTEKSIYQKEKLEDFEILKK